MGTQSPFLLTHPARSVAIALSLSLLILLCSCCCCCSTISLCSAFLTVLLVLAFSTCCSPSLLSDLRRLRETDSAPKPPPNSSEQEEEEEESNSKKSASEITDRLARGLDESPKEDAISDDDDESLIEIALPEGIRSYAGDDDDEDGVEDLSEFSAPSSALNLQNGLLIMDDQLLAEMINEEDNLIEIDIARGSIKCSRLSIKA